MALWSHLQISCDTWKALCHRHNDKKSTSSDSPQLRLGSTATTTTSPAGLVLASAQLDAVSSAAYSSPISSESSSSSSTTSTSENNRTPSRLDQAPSSESSSNLPTSTSSLVPTACSPPTSRPPGAPYNHITLISRNIPLANHVTSTCHRARSQHDHLAPPLQQLLQACRTCSCSLNGPYPALDISRNLSNVHTKLLNSVLEVISKLSLLETLLRHVNSIGTVTLSTIERELEDVDVLIRKLRRFEERIKRYLRLEAEKGGGGGLEVIAMVRDRFSPEMRDFICGMNLLAVRVQFTGLQLGRGLGSSRVPGAGSFEN